jgi:peptidylprolyl isomerase domain and WD repeat-containing protein 1
MNFDMISLFKLNYEPYSVCWIYQKGQSQALLAVSEKETKNIHLYDGRGGPSVIKTITPHPVPVHIMRFNPIANTVVSIDEGGMVEYWKPDLSSESKGWEFPESPDISFHLKSETDLYEFKKTKAPPQSLQFSHDYEKLVLLIVDLSPLDL